MNKGLIIIALATLLAALAIKSGLVAQERSMEIPAPRNPELAIQEQYDAAVAQGTKSAYTLFIQRYPKHRLAHKMRNLMKKLGMKTP